MMRKWLTTVGIAAGLFLSSAPVAAQSCAGFTDVDAGSSFCPNVTWLKNRGITLGCAPGLYCPTDAVSRLAMAVFLNRTGDVATPKSFESYGSASGGVSILGDGMRLMSGGAGQVVDYSRRVQVTGVCSVRVTDAAVVTLDIPISTDLGATWEGVNGIKANATSAIASGLQANHTVSITVQGQRTIPPGATELYAVRVRAIGGPGDSNDVRCTMHGIVVALPAP
jgi:hypothetical protein